MKGAPIAPSLRMSPESILAYLDTSINYWRAQRDDRTSLQFVAPDYIDAFQSVRTTLFGEALA